MQIERSCACCAPAPTASGYAELVAFDGAEVLLISAEPFMTHVKDLAAAVCRSVQAWWALRRSIRQLVSDSRTGPLAKGEKRP